MAVVLLSVGGQLFTTTQATLTSPLAHGSMLETLVELHTQRLQDALSPAGHSADATSSSTTTCMQPTLLDGRHPDALFIDRDGSNFGYVLSYLRDGAEMVLPADLHTTNLVLREAQFYQLTGLIKLLQDHRNRFEQEAARVTLLSEMRVQDMQTIHATLGSINNSLADHFKKQAELLGSIDASLAEHQRLSEVLHNYLTPDALYHRGKRGGLNYQRPRNLLDDLQSTIWTTEQPKSSR